MLFKRILPDGRTREINKPLLISAKQGYVRPKIDFQTSTTIWPVDEVIKRRVRDWRRLTGEDGHTGERAEKFRKDHFSVYTGTYSVFPIPLMEYLILRYAGPPGTKILDTFCGGPPRAIASSIMGHEYHGVDVRQEQIDENLAILKPLGLENIRYYLDDARYLDSVDGDFDVAITCPPYFNLEVYSDQDDDISSFNSYPEFSGAMLLNALATFERLKEGAFCILVVGNFRDKTKELVDFRGHTVENFRDAGFVFHQDIILSKNFASAAKRAGNSWKGLKLVPRHEHALVFRKPFPKAERRVRL
jgi:hypothetical protein